MPAIIEADDDGMYVLKFRGAGQGPRALVAELVSGEIARALGLPVPEIVFVKLDVEHPGLDLPTLHRHLDAIRRVCAGGADAGPIGLLPQRARLHWLTARRSALIQTSTVHMGRCGDMDAIVDHLMDRMVRVRPLSAARDTPRR